ncbi:unnamed protein product, partial [Scytosiphon promiscuus]
VETFSNTVTLVDLLRSVLQPTAHDLPCLCAKQVPPTERTLTLRNGCPFSSDRFFLARSPTGYSACSMYGTRVFFSGREDELELIAAPLRCVSLGRVRYIEMDTNYWPTSARMTAPILPPLQQRRGKS